MKMSIFLCRTSVLAAYCIYALHFIKESSDDRMWHNIDQRKFQFVPWKKNVITVMHLTIKKLQAQT